MRVKNFWTQGKKYAEAREYLYSLPENIVIVSYAAEAEASALISMGIDPMRFKWIDLQLEVKMLYNHNNILVVGDHIKDGRVVSIRPKAGEYGGIYVDKAPTSLASALYRFLKVKIDSDHKNKMRDIILSHDDALILKHADDIMRYCESDTKYLPRLFDEICKWLKRCVPSQHQGNLLAEMFLRGEYSVRTAKMVRHGYPINVEWAKNLAANVPIALAECAKDINSQFEIKPFKFDKKSATYKMDTKVIREWIGKQNFKNWQKTDTGMYSLALEAWEDHFHFRHDFPRNNFGAQIVRYLKLQQSLRSFNIKEESKTGSFFDTVGSDGFSRPYHNIYGAQSSRTQPKSTGFLFLKSAWTRSLCQPPEGYAIGAIDYSSQEFLLSALCSQDQKMIDAYREGDVYLYYGKGIGLIPPNGTKKTHSAERDLCKSTVLGLSYLMTKVGLAKKLTQDTGRLVTEAEADELVMKFDRLFSVFSQWRERAIQHYQVAKYVRLPDGWTMFADNPSFRSAANMPIQGAGAAIMRKAVSLAQDKGLTVIFSLHDALYIMSKHEEIDKDLDLLGSCMREAFAHYFTGKAKEDAKLIRLDFKAWGPGFGEDAEIYSPMKNKISVSKFHIDPRSKTEYAQFERFFHSNPGIELL